jgi:ribosomal protein S20
MKRISFLLISILFAGSILIGPGIADAHEENVETQKTVKLNQKQQKELDALYQDLFKKHKQIIDKYVEYGVFTQEKADKILSHMEEKRTKLKENGYVPKWDRNKHHQKHQKSEE